MADSRENTTVEENQDDDARAEESNRLGPIYDAALRGVMEGDPMLTCRFLGIPVVGEPKVLPAEFPAWTKSVDLLMEVGPGELAHVEYARRGERKLVTRMLGYRHLIMRDYPEDELSQHIIVLGEGRVEGHDDPVKRRFWLDLDVHYLRELDPDLFLANPGLAPLAPLGRGSPEVRARACADAIRLIRERGGSRTEDLLDFASVLATITLDRRTVKTIIEEVGMTAESIAEFYRDTIWGHVLHDVGREEGIEQGIEQGIEEGRERFLIDLLRDRFGPDENVPLVAHRLAGWPGASAAHAINSASSLQDLARAEPPG